MSMAKRFIEMQSTDYMRTKAAKVALEQVFNVLTPSSVIGIGTGETVEIFIQFLKQCCAAFSNYVSS